MPNRLLKSTLLAALLGTLVPLGCKPSDVCLGPNPPDSCTAACTGCTSDGACLDGTSPQACGVDGQVCTACGSGQSCRRDGSCGIDLDSRWSIAITSATFAATDEDGVEWAAGGAAPAPYASIYCPSTQRVPVQTMSRFSSFNPTWTGFSCSMTAEEAIQLGFGYLMETRADPFTPKLVHKFTEPTLVEGPLTINAPYGSLLSVTFQVTKLP